ncbi:hypothetical protein C0995_009998, partial [Termitomyces sp. Mi166
MLQQLALAWVPQNQGFNLINGFRLSAAPQGPGAPFPSGYGSGYGFLLFGMSNAGNLGGAPPLDHLSGPWAAPPQLVARPLGGGASRGVFLGGPPDGGPSSGWGPAISAFLPHSGTKNHYYYYYNAGALAKNNNNQGDSGGLPEALAHEEQLDIQKPKLFSRHNPQ